MLQKRATKWALAALASPLVISLTGCSQQEWDRGLLPGAPDAAGNEATNHAKTIVGFWTGSWAVLWAVGIVAWAIMVYALIAYRRRKGDNTIPKQIRYNNPIETLFTVVPMILVVGFFAFTAKTMTDIETQYTDSQADVVVEAIGKQWSWDFNYVKESTYETGVQATDATVGAKTIAEIDNLPTLWLPVNKKIRIDLASRDVDHSFWVIDFLYKKDMLPGKTNHMSFITTKEGEYRGKCAELCGEFHSMMLFKVKVVSQSAYEAHVTELKAAGNNGQLDDKYSRNQNLPGNGDNVSNEG
ncbi:MAG: cytochrome c oxidase subunit II [Actinomycetales bacterium]|nr:cytochrome c oxidase subunit II [Actinomycetales bacterium]